MRQPLVPDSLPFASALPDLPNPPRRVPGIRHYEFGPFRLDPTRHLLFRDDLRLPVTPRALDLLLVLVDHRDRVLDKDELLRLVWPDRIVEEANLSQNVFVLRKALGERPRDHRFILTVSGRGYQFVGDVREHTTGRAVPADPDAVRADLHQAYLKGRYFWNKRTEDGFSRAMGWFEQALTTDPRYALAYAGIADCRNLLSTYGAVAPSEGYLRAASAAATALRLDETLAEAHTSLAYASLNYYWDFATAEREFERAMALRPTYATAHHLYADLLTAAGRFPEALAAIRRAQALDPVSLIINTDMAWVLLHARQYDAAIRQVRDTLDLDPSFWYAHWMLGVNYLSKGEHARAIDAFQEAQTVERASPSPYAIAALGHAYAAGRYRREALATLDELREMATRRYVSPFIVATLYGALEEYDHAFAWLTRAYDDRSHWLMYIDVSPLLDPLRGDARFDALARRVRARSRR